MLERIRYYRALAVFIIAMVRHPAKSPCMVCTPASTMHTCIFYLKQAAIIG